MPPERPRDAQGLDHLTHPFRLPLSGGRFVVCRLRPGDDLIEGLHHIRAVDAVVGMTLKNKGKVADALLRVEAPDAASAELRDQDKAVARIEIAPGAELFLHGKGLHILLKGVRKTLFAYNNLYITLIFAKAGRIKVEVVVEDRPS